MVWKLAQSGSERLTGAGPRSQRGLESPGAEVGRCSLKDEGDRQGDKHGPLSTRGSSIFVFFLFYSHFSSAPGPSFFLVYFFGLLFVYFSPGSRTTVRWEEKDALRRCTILSLSLSFWRFLCVCRDFDSLDSHFWVPVRGFLQPRDRGGRRCGPVTCVFQLFRRIQGKVHGSG